MNLQRVASSAVRLAFEALTKPATQVIASPFIKGIGQRPAQARMGLVKLSFVTVSSLYVGGMIAQKGASYLEENEIFVPSDDDDDDD